MSYFQSAVATAGFESARATKRDLFNGAHLFAGLNCFEPGQSQKIHTHAGRDKLYLVVSGRARIRVGDEVQVADAGTLVWAPADVPHGVEEALERTVMVVVMGGGVAR
ncbi:MAG: cupin domain-containing protein [Gemmatimonadales bacterium]